MRIARWVHQCRVDQTKETHAFTCADELLGDLETHQAAKRMSRKKIGAAWLQLAEFRGRNRQPSFRSCEECDAFHPTEAAAGQIPAGRS